MNDREARAVLTRIAEPGDLRMTRLVAQLGASAVVKELRADRDLGGVLSEVAERLRGLDPARELALAERQSIRFVVPGDPEWPPGLDDLTWAEPLNRRGGPPLGLWVKGPAVLAELVSTAVAVVGSRSATSYGAGVAASIAAEVVSRGVCVVSGAAFGIDHAAHRGALGAQGPTVAVLACGVDRAYPPAHGDLLAHIAETYAVVSELPPGSTPTKLRFLTRNRLIAALTRGTVVVEAAARSGALNTANWAARLNRSLMGVPGPVTSAPSEGVHELLRAGAAQLVTCGEHVLELVSPTGRHAVVPTRGDVRRVDALTERELRVLDALPVSRGATVASVARAAGLAEAAVARDLEQLSRTGLAELVDGGWRLGDRPARRG
jgi:DNA processing protein